MKNNKKQLKSKEKKQVEALKVLDTEKNQKLNSIEGLFLKEMRNDEIKNEMYEIKKWGKKIKQKYLKYEINRYEYDFSNLKQ